MYIFLNEEIQKALQWFRNYNNKSGAGEAMATGMVCKFFYFVEMLIQQAVQCLKGIIINPALEWPWALARDDKIV